ncbi:Polysaccharide deacetylase [Gammaproteobacteria bacterium]
MSQFIIRFDDIAPGMAWSKFDAFERLARQYGIPYLLGVVPDCQDPKLRVEPERADFWDQVRQWQALGWTIAMHGCTHVYSTEDPGLLGINARSEFAGLPYEQQWQTLKKGKAILQQERVWQSVFMAPSHSFDRSTLNALKTEGFTHITDGYGVYPFEQDDLMMVPQLFSSPKHLGFGVYTICLHINSMNPQYLTKMLAFVQSNRQQIIDFKQAGRYIARVPFQRLANRLVCSMMEHYRSVRKKMKVR